MLMIMMLDCRMSTYLLNMLFCSCLSFPTRIITIFIFLAITYLLMMTVGVIYIYISDPIWTDPIRFRSDHVGMGIDYWHPALSIVCHASSYLQFICSYLLYSPAINYILYGRTMRMVQQLIQILSFSPSLVIVDCFIWWCWYVRRNNNSEIVSWSWWWWYVCRVRWIMYCPIGKIRRVPALYHFLPSQLLLL